MADKSPRKWLQFRLQSVLWLMLCIAIAFSAYRYGYHAGFEDQANQRSQVGSVYVKLYMVADVARMQKTDSGTVADLDGLARDISTHVLPNTWIESGGNAHVAPFQPNSALVISHDQDGHERVAAYLERLRAKKQKQLLTAR